MKHNPGFYCWITVAFLLGNDLVSNAIAALDLGLGSTQVAYLPGRETAAKNANHVHSMQTIGGKTVEIYSHSYMGAGLKSSREIISGSEPLSSSVHSLDLGDRFEDANLTASYRNADFKRCLGEVKSFVSGLGIVQLEDLQRREVYLMSYFFDSAVKAGLVPETDGPKVLIVEDFQKKPYEWKSMLFRIGKQIAFLSSSRLLGRLA